VILGDRGRVLHGRPGETRDRKVMIGLASARWSQVLDHPAGTAW